MKLVRETKKVGDKTYYNFYLVYGGLKIAIKPCFDKGYNDLKTLSNILKEVK